MNLITVNFGSSVNNAPNVDENLLRKAEYVYFDTDNLFPQKLIRLADNCPIHSAAIFKHSQFITGDGLEWDEATDAEIERANNVLKEIFGDIHAFIKACALDRAYFNGHCAALQYARGGKLLKAEHVDFSNVRASKYLDEKGKLPNQYWYSHDWKEATGRRSYTGKYVPVEPKPYGNFFVERVKRKVLFIYDKQYKPSKIYYPEPEYLAGLKYIETEIKLSQYVDNLTTKGFRAGTHIHLYKEMDEDAAKATEKKINEKFAAEDAPDIILTYGGSPEANPTINQVPNFTNAEIITTVGRELDKKIDSAHPIPSMLYTSFETASGLDGQANAIREVLEYYQNTSVAPHQTAIENTINIILEQAGVSIKCKIKQANPVNFIVDKDIMLRVLTTDEIRNEIGWPNLEGEDRGQSIPITEKRTQDAPVQ